MDGRSSNYANGINISEQAQQNHDLKELRKCKIQSNKKK
jgi:hypothetical protein